MENQSFLAFLCSHFGGKIKSQGVAISVIRAALGLPVLLLYPVLVVLLFKLVTSNGDQAAVMAISNASFVVVLGLAALGFTHASVLSATERPADRERIVMAAERLAHGAVMLLTISLLKYALQAAAKERWVAVGPALAAMRVFSEFVTFLYSLSVIFSFIGFKMMNDYYVDKNVENYVRFRLNVAQVKDSLRIIKEIQKLRRHAAAAAASAQKSLDGLVARHKAMEEGPARELSAARVRLTGRIESLTADQQGVTTRLAAAELMPAGVEKAAALDALLADVAAAKGRLSVIAAELKEIDEKSDGIDLESDRLVKDLETVGVMVEIASSMEEAAKMKWESFPKSGGVLAP